MNKKIIMGLMTGIVLVSALFIVQASGVATPYWNDNPLLLSPGESSVVTLYLQNTGEEDITVEAEITEGEVSTLEKTLYEVKVGEINVPVEVEIYVPENAQMGSVYNVALSFKQVDSGGGMVSVASAFATSFPVEVVSAEQSVLYGNEPSSSFPYLLVGLIILGIAIISLIWIRVSKKSSSKKFK